MDLANIGKKYRAATVRDIPDNYRCKEVMLRYYEEIVENMRDGVGLLLFGPKGHGKTHIAIALLKKAMAHNAVCLFLPVNRLQEVVIEKSALEFDEEDELLRDRARRADLLILDDLGEEHTKEFSTRVLENLCRYRSNRSLATIFTTNLKTDPKAGELARHYGSWIESVLKGAVAPIKVIGKDWREEQAQELQRRIEGR